MLTAQSLEPVSVSVFPSLFALPPPLSLSLSKINIKKIFLKNLEMKRESWIMSGLAIDTIIGIIIREGQERLETNTHRRKYTLRRK